MKFLSKNVNYTKDQGRELPIVQYSTIKILVFIFHTLLQLFLTTKTSIIHIPLAQWLCKYIHAFFNILRSLGRSTNATEVEFCMYY